MPVSTPLITQFKQRMPLRTGSLIVTLFGDCVAPRGGVVWLGSLIKTLQAIGIQHRLVRSAVYRLTQEGTLSNQQIGRRSFYALTPQGQDTFAAASQRIYSDSRPSWSGQWSLLLTSQLSAGERARLRKDLHWLGYRPIASEMLANPNANTTLCQARLASHDFADRVISFAASLPNQPDLHQTRKLVARTWQLDALAHSYAEFIQQFQPLLQQTQAGASLEPDDAFLVRTFLIHEFRKIILRDPGLPTDLLPADWAGHQAYTLASDLYRQVIEASERYVDQTFENQTGPLPAADTEFELRFAR